MFRESGVLAGVLKIPETAPKRIQSKMIQYDIIVPHAQDVKRFCPPKKTFFSVRLKKTNFDGFLP